MKPRKCPICGTGSLEKRVGNETFKYKEHTITIPKYITYTCAQCGEAVVDNVCLKESGRKLKDFQRGVDGLLTGGQIKSIRMKLGMTQEQLAGIIGGGLKSVARYESGKICQSKGMDNLLRILDAYPETLRVIQKNKGIDKRIAQIINIEDERNKRNWIRGKSFSTDVSGETAYGI